MDRQQFLGDVAFLLDSYHGLVVKDACPVYPAMVGFYMNTKEGEEYFLLGNNTETGDWVIDSETKNQRIAEFANTEHTDPQEIVNKVGEWLETLEIKVVF